jgi:hypothetical protein
MAGEKQLQPVVMEGMRMIFRNFAGKEGQYNREGDRNFGVILPPEVAEAMLRDGWNVKYLKPSEEEQEEGIEQGPAWLSVSVNFDKGKPPKIMLVTSRGPTKLDEHTVDQLDWVDVAADPETGNPKCDLIVRPYTWEVSGRTGIKAYLQSMYVTIEEDELERKYAELGQAQ